MTRAYQTLHRDLTRRKGRHRALRAVDTDLARLEEMLIAFGSHPPRATRSNDPDLDAAIERQIARLLDLREKPHNEYWNAELDSNAGLGAQYILMMHFIGRVDAEKQRKLANYTRQWQTPGGWWSIHTGGPGHLSYSITCYFALKLAGDSPDAPHMVKARDWILAQGGAMRAGVELRLQLALFGQYDWAGVPPIPPWLVLLPYLPQLPGILERKTINIYDLSYWCRISLVPMSVLYELKPRKTLPPELGIDELFVEPAGQRVWKFDNYTDPGVFTLGGVIQLGAKLVKKFEGTIGSVIRKVALRKARDWILSHQDDSGDWGGIYPPVMYNIMALPLLGVDLDDPRLQRAFEALDRFTIHHPEVDGDHMQACVSPVWDTAWSLCALAEAGVDLSRPQYQRHVDWLYSRQILREGDWAVKNPGAIPGGWCFQFYNDFYPDLDDTAVVLYALLWGGGFRHGKCMRSEQVRIGLEWLLSMQNKDGGWSAFEQGVDKDLVNHIPFNDLDNMLDPSTADVTGHVLETLGHMGFTRDFAPVRRGIAFIRKTQDETGAWWGRWGVNYIYGTHGVLCGLAQVGEDMTQPYVRKAVDWLYGVQQQSGAWGEDCESYRHKELAGKGEPTPSQTAWALMALMAAGEVDDPRVARGVQWLLKTQKPNGGWEEDKFTGTGFPNAFYLNYHFYREYFPLMALGRYRNLKCGLKNV
ncbi:MAG: squalene--hopene cyclase [Planctomycetes bacterium]|jgi:squalene-hopene/tetraprenyl-beta-curcumene cyclase|nr:squalene--hopene cyclase [Planctomycetota bacterium]MCL4729516.1 squalene--hopene cyclase [Planctomycetota bacterium]